MRAALDDERRLGHRAHRAQRRDDVVVAARDVELLHRADDQIEQRQDALQMRGHAVAGDEARLAVGLAVSPHSTGR